MSSSFNDVTFWKVYLECSLHILSCIVMSSSFNDVTYWKVYLESTNISFRYCEIILNDVTFWKVYLNVHSYFSCIWCHHPSVMSHILQLYLESTNMFFQNCDVIILQWCHILESLFRIFKHIFSWIVMSSSFNDVTFWNVRLVRVDTSSVLLQYTHTWQSLLSWIFATYSFVFQNNASFKEYGCFNHVFIYSLTLKKKNSKKM